VPSAALCRAVDGAPPGVCLHPPRCSLRVLSCGGIVPLPVACFAAVPHRATGRTVVWTPATLSSPVLLLLLDCVSLWFVLSAGVGAVPLRVRCGSSLWLRQSLAADTRRSSPLLSSPLARGPSPPGRTGAIGAGELRSDRITCLLSSRRLPPSVWLRFAPRVSSPPASIRFPVPVRLHPSVDRGAPAAADIKQQDTTGSSFEQLTVDARFRAAFPFAWRIRLL
jgi:hypothetical protein